MDIRARNAPEEVLSLYRGIMRIERAPEIVGDETSIRAISEEVAARYHLTLEQLRGPGRSLRISRPRQEIMWRCYQTGKFSNQQIGNYLGNRDWTTVIHGRRAHAKRHGLQVW
jgi:chromosomal replication initiation ATPase DnaA